MIISINIIQEQDYKNKNEQHTEKNRIAEVRLWILTEGRGLQSGFEPLSVYMYIGMCAFQDFHMQNLIFS